MSIIGREPPADIVVAAPQVSARHAHIEHVRDDLYMLTDLGSSNGTWVNDRRVTSAFVRRTDRIRLGSCAVDLDQWVSRVPRPSATASADVSCPPPPNLHWALILVVGVVTLGVFPLLWWIRVARWATRQNPVSKALVLVAIGISLPAALTVAVISMSVFGAFTLSWAAAGDSVLVRVAFPVTMFLMTTLLTVAAFEVRAAVQDYGRQQLGRPCPLSGVVTFCVPLLYLQYHMSRLAAGRGN